MSSIRAENAWSVLPIIGQVPIPNRPAPGPPPLILVEAVE